MTQVSGNRSRAWPAWLPASLIILILIMLAAVVYTLIVRPMHMRWGATDAEIASTGMATLIGVFAAVFQCLALLVARGLLALTGPVVTPRRAAAVGGAVAALLALAPNWFVWQALGVFFSQLWPGGYLFWLGLPSVIYVAANGWATYLTAVSTETSAHPIPAIAAR